MFFFPLHKEVESVIGLADLHWYVICCQNLFGPYETIRCILTFHTLHFSLAQSITLMGGHDSNIYDLASRDFPFMSVVVSGFSG